MAKSTNQGLQPFKYNGKEFDNIHALNQYDYGARWYDPAMYLFTSMDPMCEKYYHISPYSYCGGNPVNRVDLDGKDYIVSFEEGAKKRVVISGVYYTDEKGYPALCNGVSFWNGLSGKYKFRGYPIVFDLKAEVTIDGKIPLSEKNEGVNTFSIKRDLRVEGYKYPDANGITIHGNDIIVKEISTNTNTPAHEIGHTLGLNDLLHPSEQRFIMYYTNYERYKNPVVSKSMIQSIINFGLGNESSRSGAKAFLRINGNVSESSILNKLFRRNKKKDEE